MSSNPQGDDAPLGDNPESIESALSEGFLGSEEPSPTSGLQQLESAGHADGTPNGPTEDELLSLLPGAGSGLEALDEFSDGEDFDLELGDEEDSASWLMEFDPESTEEESEESFAESLFESEPGLESGEEQEDEAEPSNRRWITQAILVGLSVFMGVIASKYIPGLRTPSESPIPPRVAQLDPAASGATEVATLETEGNTTESGTVPEAGATPAGGAESLAAAGTQGDSQSTTSESELAATNLAGPPTSEGSLPTEPVEWPSATDGEPTVSDAGPAPAQPTQPVEWETPESGTHSRVLEVALEDMVILPGDSNGLLRSATTSEMRGMWQGDTIPMESIRGAVKVMTPGVGRVRVVLASGEVFEGKLYAVGERKVWIETQLGKMALLDWQIDRVEHIVGADGQIVTGHKTCGDTSGLQGVRVRAAGGVFYGRLLSKQGSTVTIVTDEGARITLEDAHVETAGRTTSYLVDGTRAEPETDRSTGLPKKL